MCTAKQCMREDALEQEIERILEGISIPAPFKDWCLEKLEMTLEEEAKQEKALQVSRKSAIEQASKQQERLTDMYLDGLLDASEYQEKKAELKKRILRLEENQSTS